MHVRVFLWQRWTISTLSVLILIDQLFNTSAGAFPGSTMMLTALQRILAQPWSWVSTPCFLATYYHVSVLGQPVVNFQARHFGLCFVAYVYDTHNTRQFVPDLFGRIFVLGAFQYRNAEFLQLMQCDKTCWELFWPWSYRGNSLYYKRLFRTLICCRRACSCFISC